MFQAELRVATGKQMGSVISLPVGKFLVGREEDCHLRPNSDLVSRHHCVFTSDEYSIRLRDLGSTNGTFVNGERIRGQVILKEGDRVVIGKLEFDVVVRDPSMEDTSTNLSQATQTEVGSPAAQPEPIPADRAASETMVELPTGYSPGDTAFGGMPQPNMGMYGQPPLGYPQPYPQMQYGYPGYQMPGYYQQPMAYPPMGMYPGMAPQMMPGQAMPASSTVAEPAIDPSATMEMRLPDPETTGAKPPEPKPVVVDATGKPASMRDTAADIINKYRTRPPAG